MTVLELRFSAGRYHATPWGRHVNEGAVEWPPAPWRILRALIATWRLKALEIPEATIRALLGSLSQPPAFHLPPASTSHTRHYMPLGNEKTTKVFDTFIQIGERDAVLIAWDADLPADEFNALRTLADRLGYFGRAESLVEVRVLDGVTGIAVNAKPLAEGETAPLRTELIRLLAPMQPAAYEQWRSEFTTAAVAALGSDPTAAQKKKLPVVPPDLFTALHADTGDLQAAGWNLPPGSAFVNYIRPENAFAPAPRPRALRQGPPPTVARYEVVSAVAPRITQAISIGDRVHDALCKWSDQGEGRAAVFTGLDEHGKPSAQHQHAHIFCETNGSCDTVTHITVWAPMGFDEAACLALRRLNKVWGHGGHDLRLILHGIGQESEFPSCPLLGSSKKWCSLTPFVSTRHAKTFRDGRPKMDETGWQQGSAAHDLLRLLALDPRMAGATIKLEPVITLPNQTTLRNLQFQTIRHDGAGRRGHDLGAALIIEFPEPIIGPLALGYGSHFGLGLFVPASKDGKEENV